MQAGFALVETLGWGRWFVDKAAGSWLTTLETTLRTEYGVTDATDLAKLVDNHVGWAGNLAFNIGVYNLALAVGLAWVARAGASVARPLGVFLAIWLLMAALAAAWTGVMGAFIAQGALGLLMLSLSLRASASPALARA